MAACDLHYERCGPTATDADGDTAPLVLAGSMGSTLAMWDPQIDVLARDRTVLRIDHRGHGGSPIPPGPYALADLGADVLALLDRLAIGRASFCGISLGGMVGIWLAANAPERVDRLVLCCTSAHPGAPEAWAQRAADVRAAGTVAVVADTVVDRWLTPSYAAAHPHVHAKLRAMLAASPADGYAACCEALEGLDLRTELGAIRAPTLVISGAQDLSLPAEHGRRIADGIEGARFVTLAPAAHLVSVERSAEVNRLVREHLDLQTS